MNVPVVGRFPSAADLLEAPSSDIADLLAGRRTAKRRAALLADRGMILSPLVLLAACGGGGGGGGEGPGTTPPPPGGGTPTPTPPGGGTPTPTPPGGGTPTPTPPGGTPTPTPPGGGTSTTIDLGALGAGGVALSAPGAVAGGQFGFSIATLQAGGTGDVVGNGNADLVVGAPGANGGRVYVFDGANLSAAPARTLSSDQKGSERFGYDVAVGNVGGDGRADVVVGAPGYTSPNANAGRAFGFLGGTTFDSGNPVGANGFTYTINNTEGTAAFPNAAVDLGPNVGAAVAVLSDINGDGVGDFFVATPGLNLTVNNVSAQDVGTAFVGFGQATFPAGTRGIPLNSSTSEALTMAGDFANDGEGYTAAASGNVNGAGGADLVVADARKGQVLVVFNGPALSGSQPLGPTTNLDGTTGVRLVSNEANARFGESVAVGDVNGDGRADVIVGAPGVNKVYVLLGAASYASGTINVASPGSATVIEISGTGGFGTSVAFVGNFNGDARGDFVVGAPTDGANGSAYILLGSSSTASSAYSLSGGNSVKLTGGQPGTGVEVAGPGDLNGDGLADVAVGAVNGTNTAGAVYVVYGRSLQASSSVGVEALLDDGSNDIMGGGRSGASFVMDPLPTTADLPPNDLLV